MIKCIIVEDEKLARDVIISHLSKTPELELIGVCANSFEAAAILRKKEVDLVFLDIQLPGITGLNFLRMLKDPPLVIITTAYAEYALESYEFNVMDYLLKPISPERFKKAVEKLLNGRLYSFESGEKPPGVRDYIFIKSSNKFFRVNFSEIIYIQGMKDYLKIFTPEYKLVTHQTMGDMEQLLPSSKFLRVHKSYIVGLGHIKTANATNVEMHEVNIPVGISYKDKLMGFIKKK